MNDHPFRAMEGAIGVDTDGLGSVLIAIANDEMSAIQHLTPEDAKDLAEAINAAAEQAVKEKQTNVIPLPAPKSKPRAPAAEEPKNIFPVAILMDRYHGVYSGGEWIAVAQCDAMDNGAYRIVRLLEGGPYGDDGEAADFWSKAGAFNWIAVGQSAGEALLNLYQKATA